MGQSFRSNINSLAFPAIIAGIAEPVISLTDIAVIGNVEENPVEALAAAGIVGSFLSAMIWIVAQMKTAVSAIVSQHYGARRIHAVKTLVPQTLLFNLILSLFLFLITTLFARQVFSLYNAEGLVLDYAEDYYQIRAIGYPFVLLTFTLFGVFRGLQNTIWAMKCSISGALVNVLLDYVLVYGIDGLIPAMHLKGAAYASVIAQIIMLLMALRYFFLKTPFKMALGRVLNPKIKPLLQMSANLFVRTSALNIAIFMANAYATDYGSSFMAAQSILMNLWLFFSFFIDGYASAGNAIAGKLLGARDYQGLWRLGLKISKYAVGVAIGLSILCTLAYNHIGPLFTSSLQVISIVEGMFWLVLIMQPINAIAFVFDGIFKGLGEAKYLRNVLLTATFLAFIPVLYVADMWGLKLLGIWIAFFIWMLVRGGALILKFRKKYLNMALTP